MNFCSSFTRCFSESKKGASSSSSFVGNSWQSLSSIFQSISFQKSSLLFVCLSVSLSILEYSFDVIDCNTNRTRIYWGSRKDWRAWVVFRRRMRRKSKKVPVPGTDNERRWGFFETDDDRKHINFKDRLQKSLIEHCTITALVGSDKFKLQEGRLIQKLHKTPSPQNTCHKIKPAQWIIFEYNSGCCWYANLFCVPQPLRPGISSP